MARAGPIACENLCQPEAEKQKKIRIFQCRSQNIIILQKMAAQGGTAIIDNSYSTIIIMKLSRKRKRRN
ncbi:hypothetical protein JP39_05205 [Companilactobacillus heilongjiangensis]|uniref:Uncharacterized protein n=1 Tax=Companilactobacillus heilongjiangensis TaxID=1074467 RepID=A0A0K2LC14_9LACO|nr:hypothetical protein JP39_05205 [Companilactobacillus heilongjiangensis]